MIQHDIRVTGTICMYYYIDFLSTNIKLKNLFLLKQSNVGLTKQSALNESVVILIDLHYHYFANFTFISYNPFRHPPTIPCLKCCV